MRRRKRKIQPLSLLGTAAEVFENENAGYNSPTYPGLSRMIRNTPYTNTSLFPNFAFHSILKRFPRFNESSQCRIKTFQRCENMRVRQTKKNTVRELSLVTNFRNGIYWLKKGSRTFRPRRIFSPEVSIIAIITTGSVLG